jgi:hemoglobin
MLRFMATPFACEKIAGLLISPAESARQEEYTRVLRIGEIDRRLAPVRKDRSNLAIRTSMRAFNAASRAGGRKPLADLDQHAVRRLAADFKRPFPLWERFGMSATGSELSLFDRIGGTAGVARLVADFYARVLADAKLKPYFEHVTMSKLWHMQSEFFAVALGGPVHYSGRPMLHAHQGRHINRGHFEAFVQHLFETLKDYALTDSERDTVIARINTYADDVIEGGAAA